MSEWGDRIKAALERPHQPKLSQAGLARACKISSASVSDWVNDNTNMISGDNLIAAARYLNVSADWIMTGRGKMDAVSQPERIDPATLEDAVKLLGFVDELQDPPAPPERYAHRLAVAYQIALEESAQVFEGNIVDMAKRLAARLRAVDRGNDIGDQRGKTA